MDKTERFIILLTVLGLALIALFAFSLIGCSDVPYTGPIRVLPDGTKIHANAEWEQDGFTCYWDGFDKTCVVVRVQIRKVKVEVDRIVEVPGETVYIEVPVDRIVEVVKVIEVPGETIYIEVPVDRIVEVEKILEVPCETVYVEVPDETVYMEVPTEKIVEIFKIVEVPGETVYVEVPTEKIVEVEKIVEIFKIVEVPGETVYVEVPTEKIIYRDKIVYRDPPPEPPLVIIENKVYDSQDYLDWIAAGKPSGTHEHIFSHTHDGVPHKHRIAHPDGQADNWDREHDGWDGVSHE